MSPAALSWELAWHVQSPAEAEPVLVVVAPVGHALHPTASPASALYWCSGHAVHVSASAHPEYPALHTNTPSFSSEWSTPVQLLLLVAPWKAVPEPSGHGSHPALPTAAL